MNRLRSNALRLSALAGLISLAALGATPAQAGCGCDKPPPPPAQVRPDVTYAGMPVVLFGPTLREGDAYDVTFTAGAAQGQATGLPSSATVQSVVTVVRDLADGVYKPQLVVSLPRLPLGPASIVAMPAKAGPAISVSDASFTVAPTPIAVPTDADEYHFAGYQAAVGRDGVVYISLDLTGLRRPIVFEAQALGYPLRFSGSDIAFFNVQGFLMQKLVEAAEPVPGMFVFPAANPATDSDTLHYSRHEFATYFLQHAERLPHSLDPNDANWHLDGTRHVDHDHLILTLLGKMNDGSYPAAGATPAFDLLVNTYSLFFQGLVGASSVEMESATTDSYDSTTGMSGSQGHVMTNGTLRIDSASTIQGNATASRFDLRTSPKITGTKITRRAAVSFMEVKVPPGLTSLGSFRVHSSGATIVGPGSFAVTDLAIDSYSTLFIDNTAGPVTLYVTGSFNMAVSSSIRVADGKPEHFAVYMPGSQSVSLEGSRSAFSGVLYAPKASLEVRKGGNFYGAFVAGTVRIREQARVHFDSSLGRSK